MIYYDKARHLLEIHNYDYSLQDVESPNLHREIFDYNFIPKITFNNRVVPMNMPENIYITDTTFRDGQQGFKPFTVKQIVRLYKFLHKLGGRKGIIRQSEFFIYTDKDKEAVYRCMELGYAYPQITSWIRANKKDFELVKEMGVMETGILVSCSDYHIFNKMHMTRREAVDMYLSIVKMALERNIVPRCHFEDITRADFYGFVVPFAIELMKLSKEAGMPIKIRACDTMGYGMSFPGVSLPRSVPGIIYGLNHHAEVPSSQLEWHGHNDFYRVVNNASTAWLYGAGSVNCSMLGIGERTGNCPLEAMVIEYCGFKGHDGGMNLPVITEIAEYFAKELEYVIPSRTPFVGRAFNSTRAGIHADGMLKDPEIYNIFNTELLLNRPPVVAVDVHSGLAGIAFWINAYYNLPDKYKVGKREEEVIKMKELIDKEYAEGRNTVMSDKELHAMFKKVAPERYNKIKKIKKIRQKLIET
jgi:isopropylmalate/homocitrate/citramalate synthase